MPGGSARPPRVVAELEAGTPGGPQELGLQLAVPPLSVPSLL